MTQGDAAAVDQTPQRINQVKPGEPVKISASAPNPDESIANGQGIKLSYDNVENMEPREYMKHVALWIDPILSTKFISGMTVLWYYTGQRGYTFITFVTMLMLLRTVVFFSLNYFGASLSSKDNKAAKMIGTNMTKISAAGKKMLSLPTEKSLKYWFDGLSNYLSTKLGAGVKTLEKAETDVKAMKTVVAHLFGFVLVFSIFSLRTILFGTFYGLMLIPPVYVRQQDKIDPILDNAKAKAQPYVTKISEQAEIVGQQLSVRAEAFKSLAGEKVGEVSTKISDKIGQMRKSNVDEKKQN